MPEIPIGTKGHIDLLVTSEVAIDFMGLEGTRVLSTPHLVWHLEMAARNAVKPLLGKDFDSVGTEIHVRHLAATPLGMHVRFDAEVTAVDNRRVLFRITARDEKELVAEGAHERFVVNIERFAAKVQTKSSSMPPETAPQG